MQEGRSRVLVEPYTLFMDFEPGILIPWVVLEFVGFFPFGANLLHTNWTSSTATLICQIRCLFRAR